MSTPSSYSSSCAVMRFHAEDDVVRAALDGTFDRDYKSLLDTLMVWAEEKYTKEQAAIWMYEIRLRVGMLVKKTGDLG